MSGCVWVSLLTCPHAMNSFMSITALSRMGILRLNPGDNSSYTAPCLSMSNCRCWQTNVRTTCESYLADYDLCYKLLKLYITNSLDYFCTSYFVVSIVSAATYCTCRYVTLISIRWASQYRSGRGLQAAALMTDRSLATVFTLQMGVTMLYVT